MGAVNELVGNGGAAGNFAAAPEVVEVRGPVSASQPDGTEWALALIVLGSLAFLAMLEAGGFKTMLAASVTTGRS